MRIDPAALARADQRVEHRGAVAGVRVAHEQPVLLTEGRGTNRVLDGVVVDLGATVLEVRGQRLPVTEQVGACLAEVGSGQAKPVELFNGLLEQRERRA